MVSSGDIPECELGECLLDVVLHPGDMLYFPRGTIHYAVTLPERPSTHITLSNYQRQNYYELLNVAMPRLMDSYDLPSLRDGLPIKCFERVGGTIKGEYAASGIMRAKMCAILRSLADKLENGDPHDIYDVLNASVDELSIDFTTSRLPPRPGAVQSNVHSGTMAAPNDNLSGKCVRMVNWRFVKVIVGEGSGDDYDGGCCLRVYHGLRNTRREHMGSAAEPPEF